MVQQIRSVVHIRWNPDLMRKTRCRAGQTSVPSRLCDVVISDADTLAHRVYFGPEYRTYINRFFNVAVPVSSRPCATCTFFPTVAAVAAAARRIYFPVLFISLLPTWRFDKWQSSEKLEVSGFHKSLVLLSKLHCSDTHKLRTDYRFIISISDTLVSVCICIVEG